MDTCDNCGCPLQGVGVTLPWEDGDNPEAYVICPQCGEKNIVYGYGEDDD